MKRLTLTAVERAELFIECAARRGLSPVIIEKDYWVCIALNALFGEPQRVNLIFKGGTSLSKGYGLIERFSEDVDLAFDREALGFTGARDPEAEGLTGKQRKALVNELTEVAVHYIADEFRADTQRRLGELVAGTDDWHLELDANDLQTLLFVYPTSLQSDLYAATDYIRPRIRLELGARSDHTPSEQRDVVAIATEEFGAELSELAAFSVPMLAAERTFWEKVSLLHAEAHREQPRADATAMSRHLYDVARLWESEFGQRAAQDETLRTRVIDHKSLFFSSAQARYDLFTPGSIRLLPIKDDRLSVLRADYEAMNVMFFGERPSFDELLNTLGIMERALNAGGSMSALATV